MTTIEYGIYTISYTKHGFFSDVYVGNIHLASYDAGEYPVNTDNLVARLKMAIDDYKVYGWGFPEDYKALVSEMVL